MKPMSKMMLVRYDNNYADEFDVSGFIVMPEKDWEQHKVAVTKLFESLAAKPLPEPDREYSRLNREARQVEVYFGTNESMIYESLEDYFSSFNVTELDDTELAILQRLFGANPKSGMICMIDDYAFEVEEQNE